MEEGRWMEMGVQNIRAIFFEKKESENENGGEKSMIRHLQIDSILWDVEGELRYFCGCGVRVIFLCPCMQN